MAVTSLVSPRCFTATWAVTCRRAEVSCISGTLLTRSWNIMEHTYGLCDVILDSLSLRIFSESHVRGLMKSHSPLSFCCLLWRIVGKRAQL